MYSLVCDTSSKTFVLLLASKNTIIDKIIVNNNIHHTININSYILDLLYRNNLSLLDIDRFICGQGPGSYTGCRVSVCVFKMICALLNKDLYSISSLLLLCSGYLNEKVLIYSDQKNNNIFAIGVNNNYIFLNEGFYNLKDINEYNNIKKVSIENFKFDFINISKHINLVSNIDLFEPNYLRATQAEREYNNVNPK